MQTGNAPAAKDQASVHYMPSVVRRPGVAGGANAKAESGGSNAHHALSGGTSFVQREQQPRIAFKSAYKSRVPPAAGETQQPQQQRSAAQATVKDGPPRSSTGASGAAAAGGGGAGSDSSSDSKGPTPPPELVPSSRLSGEQLDAIGGGARANIAVAESDQFDSTSSNGVNSQSTGSVTNQSNSHS